MSIDLDPHEVLHHLYSLGYYNITKEQLKDFIKDLKKLIKYDLRKQERLHERPEENFLKPNKENECYDLPTRDAIHCKKRLASRHAEKLRPCSNQEVIPENVTEKLHSEKERFRLKAGTPSVTVHSHICPKCHHILDCTQVCSSSVCAAQCDKDDTEAGSSSDEGTRIISSSKLQRIPSKTKKKQTNLKPCPSFIRSSNTKLKPPPKADPVALYHYYKTFWSQHTLPGENSHEDLRWRIRHKMNAPPVLARTQSETSKRPDWMPS